MLNILSYKLLNSEVVDALLILRGSSLKDLAPLKKKLLFVASSLIRGKRIKLLQFLVLLVMMAK